MNYKKRIISLMTAAVMLAGIGSGCANKGEGTAEESTVSETSSSLSSQTEAVTQPLPASDTEMADFTVKSIVPEKTEGVLASVDTAFTIVLDEDINEADLKPQLKLSQGIDFTLHKTAECTYSLKPIESLQKNSIASIGLVNKTGDVIYSWAFQTECALTVDEVYPAPDSSYVSVDTGIELTFSCPVDAKEAERCISIYPATAGSFESHGNKVYFIPEHDLKTRTTYYVTVSEGLGSADGIVMEDPYKFSFDTSSSRGDTYFYTDKMSETFLEGDLPVIEVYASENILSQKCSLKLYRYPDDAAYRASLEDYIKDGKKSVDHEFSSEGLECVYSNDSVDILEGTDSWRAAFILLPEILEQGGYLAEVSTNVNGEEYRLQRHIQVSPISVYASSLSGRSGFFINDTVSGEACGNAKISLMTQTGEFTAETSSDGTAFVEIPDSFSAQGLLTVSWNGSTFCDVLDYDGDRENDPRDDYYMYLYTDREAYLPNDKINVWGVIRPRKDSVPVPEDLTLALNYEFDDNGELMSNNVVLMPDGTFTSSFTLTDWKDSWFSVELRSGERMLTSKGVSVYEYEKPIYVLDAYAPEYAVSPQTVPVPVDIEATLFEGSPAPDVHVELTTGYYDRFDTDEIITDIEGKAHGELLYDDNKSWRPQRCSITYSVAGIENTFNSQYLNFYGFFRDVMIENEYDEDTKSITLTSSKIVPEAIAGKDDIYYYSDYSFLRGDPYEADVHVKISRSWSEKKPSGSYYDFLQKKNVTTYTYEFFDKVVYEKDVTCTGGRIVLSDIPCDKDSNYYAEFSWKDSQGRETTDTCYYDTYEYSGRDTVYSYYTLAPDKYSFAENEELGFRLMRNGSHVPDAKGRILLHLFGSDIFGSKVYDTPSFTHKMTKDYIPCVDICGAYFDGRHVYPINRTWEVISFEYDERELDVSVEAEKQSYAPGADAGVKVKVTDKNGSPVAGASVIASVVDEAAFAIMDQKADPISYIYRPIYPDDVKQFYSYIQHTLDTNGGAEKGGGGDEPSVRKNFMDTALFETGVTSADGTCSFKLTLPDNITEWRVTAVAVKETKTDYVYAGTSKGPLISTKELFVSPIMLDEYLEGDDIALASKLFGRTGSGNIEITVSGNGVNKSMTVLKNETANFGKLPKGDYTATFKAAEGNVSDIVEMPFTVVRSLIEIPLTEAHDLDSLEKISPERWPVSVTFFNEDYMQYADTLYRLDRFAGNRLDMRIGEYFARKELGFITEEEYKSELSNIAPGGLARLMDNSEESAELTALICAAAPELVSKASVNRRFNMIISDAQSSHSHVADAYLGLAAIGKPVLTSVRGILENGAEGFDEIDKLKFCAALALMGDYQGAEKYYGEFSDKVVHDGDKAYIDGDETGKLTRTALVTESVLHTENADLMANYLISNKDKYDSSALELMIYLKNYCSDAQAECSFTYQRDGKTESVELDRFFGTNISFTKEQFENASFRAEKGNVYALARYIGDPENDSSSDLKVTKTLSGSFAPGEIVTVNISVSGKDGKYCRVYDVIPSCGRYAGNGHASGQRVRLFTDENGKASYTFRVASRGNFVVESAAVIDKGCFSVSERSEITVE